MANPKRLFIFTRTNYEQESVNYLDQLSSSGAVLNNNTTIPLDRHVKDLKGISNIAGATDNIYAKFYYLHPVIGGTSATHKWNLVNPVDSDAAFRAQYVGSPSHSANGIGALNGTSQYVRTHWIPSALGGTQVSFGFYSRTAIISGVDMGANGGGGLAQLWARVSSNQFGGRLSLSTIVAYNNNTDGRGFHCISRMAGNDVTIFKNGVPLATSSAAQGTICTREVMLGVFNDNGNLGNFSTRQYCYYYLSMPLTATQMLNYSNSVQRLQTALNRAV